MGLFLQVVPRYDLWWCRILPRIELDQMLPIIERIRASGVTTLDGIASALNTHGVRTARGGASHAMTVRNVLKRDPKKTRAGAPVYARCRSNRPFIDSLKS